MIFQGIAKVMPCLFYACFFALQKFAFKRHHYFKFSKNE
jgi:hypothetical protein